jgi:hypothetical protein
MEIAMEHLTVEQLRKAMECMDHNATLAEEAGDQSLADCFREKLDACQMVYLGRVYGEGPWGHLSAEGVTQ